jgi:hypothetical protein
MVVVLQSMASMDESFADELSSIGDPYSLAPHNSNQPHLLIKSIKRHAFLLENSFAPTVLISRVIHASPYSVELDQFV